MTYLKIDSLELQITFKIRKNLALSPRRQERSAARINVISLSVNAKF
jgi:hypothetical protein